MTYLIDKEKLLSRDVAKLVEMRGTSIVEVNWLMDMFKYLKLNDK